MEIIKLSVCGDFLSIENSIENINTIYPHSNNLSTISEINRVDKLVLKESMILNGSYHISEIITPKNTKLDIECAGDVFFWN